MNWIYITLLISVISFLIILTIHIYLTYSEKRAGVGLKRKVRKRVEEIVKPDKKEVSEVKLIVELSVFLILLSLALSHKIFWVVVVSNSMSPTFERGDLVLMQSISVHPEKGDIVLFYNPDLNLPVTHRVLDIRNGFVFTGGDASGPDSSPVKIDSIIAEAIIIGKKPIVLKDVGNYFILDAVKMRDVGPYGQEYLFYKNLINAFRNYALAIVIVGISVYAYFSVRARKSI